MWGSISITSLLSFKKDRWSTSDTMKTEYLFCLQRIKQKPKQNKSCMRPAIDTLSIFQSMRCVLCTFVPVQHLACGTRQGHILIIFQRYHQHHLSDDRHVWNIDIKSTCLRFGEKKDWMMVDAHDVKREKSDDDKVFWKRNAPLEEEDELSWYYYKKWKRANTNKICN